MSRDIVYHACAKCGDAIPEYLKICYGCTQMPLAKVVPDKKIRLTRRWPCRSSLKPAPK